MQAIRAMKEDGGLPSEAEVAEYRETFAIFDRDGDGQITAAELGAGLRALGKNPSDEDLQSLIKEVDEDGNGVIDFTEFVVMMHRKHQSTERENELKEAFKIFDLDGDGTISPSELKAAMMNMGVAMTEDEVTEMIREADANGDGFVTYEEFAAMMRWRPTLLSITAAGTKVPDH